jgi:hypothetical protein
VGDWWYGDRNAEAFAMAETAITDVWGQQPLYVREVREGRNRGERGLRVGCVVPYGRR